MKNEPNKITATLKVIVTGEFYDDEASEETLRYCVEQDLEDAGFDVDVELLKEQEAKKVKIDMYGNYYCPWCSTDKTIEMGIMKLKIGTSYCPYCGRPVSWE